MIEIFGECVVAGGKRVDCLIPGMDYGKPIKGHTVLALEETKGVDWWAVVFPNEIRHDAPTAQPGGTKGGVGPKGAATGQETPGNDATERLERARGWQTQPRDDIGRWTDGAGNLSAAHVSHVMHTEGITAQHHHDAIQADIASGALKTRAAVLAHIDAIHEAKRHGEIRAKNAREYVDPPRELASGVSGHSASDAASLNVGAAATIDGHHGWVTKVTSQTRKGTVTHPTDPNSTSQATYEYPTTTVHLRHSDGHDSTHSFGGVDHADAKAAAAKASASLAEPAKTIPELQPNHTALIAKFKAMPKNTWGRNAGGDVFKTRPMFEGLADSVLEGRETLHSLSSAPMLSGENAENLQIVTALVHAKGGHAYTPPAKEPRFRKDDMPFLTATMGFSTNTHMAIKGDAPTGAPTRGPFVEGNPPRIEKVIPEKHGAEIKPVVATTASSAMGEDVDRVTFDSGVQANTQYVNLVSGRFPGATFHHSGGLRPIIAKRAGEVVGVVMPITSQVPFVLRGDFDADFDGEEVQHELDFTRADHAADLALWQRKALNRVADGRSAACAFHSDTLPEALHADVLARLEACETKDDVRAVFALVGDWNESQHPRATNGEFGYGGLRPDQSALVGRITQRLDGMRAAGLGAIAKDFDVSVSRVVSQLKPHTLEVLELSVGDVSYYATQTQLYNELKSTDAAMPKTAMGVFRLGQFAMHVDGNVPGCTRQEVVAHEMAHAIDVFNRISNLPTWIEAWGAELKSGALTAYAATDRHEGFAEFARAVWGGKLLASETDKFPLCKAFLGCF